MKIAYNPNTCNGLPLFDWANGRRVHHLPLPARRLRDRFGLTEATAITTAVLAGFAIDGDRQ